MDADGTKDGFDLEMIARRPRARDGAGDRQRRRRPPRDFAAGGRGRRGRGAGRGVFHFGDLRIGEVKQALRDAGHPVR